MAGTSRHEELEEQAFDSPDSFSQTEVQASSSLPIKSKFNAQTPTKKRRMRNELSWEEKQHEAGRAKSFQKAWTQEEQFKGWLYPVEENKFKAKCIACDATFNAGKSEAEKHAKGAKHMKRVQATKHVRSIQEAFKGPSYNLMLDAKVKTAKIVLASFFVEHNVGLNVADHLTDLVKNIFSDSQIAKKISLDRTKSTAIVKNVIAKTDTENLVAILKEVKFSVLVDESTDIAGKKNMVILVRYATPGTGVVSTNLLRIVELDAADCSAEALFRQFRNLLDSFRVPLTNIIGVACDHAPVMVGAHNSFVSRLREVCPWLVVLDCVCHSSHIAASNACSKLPSNAVTFVRRVATYVSGSPKRCAIFEEFQELYSEEALKIKKLSGTRWLVMHPYVVRLLDNWTALEQYFMGVVLEDARQKDQEARSILDEMQNPFTKAYLFFLKYVLEYFNKMNALFQTEKVMVHKLYDGSLGLLKQVCANFMRDNVLDSVATVDLTHSHFMVNLEKMTLGPNVEDILRSVPLPSIDPTHPKSRAELEGMRGNAIKTFRLRCLDFYTTAAKQLQSYLPVKNAFVKESKFIDPSVALSSKARQDAFPSLPTLTSQFKVLLNLDEDRLYSEWRNMPHEVSANERERLQQMDVVGFWKEMAILKDFSDERKFPNLVRLAHGVLAFPHSNAEAERAFSIVTDVKCEKRNRMAIELLNAICVSRIAMRQRQNHCYQFNVTKAHLSKHHKDMY